MPKKTPKKTPVKVAAGVNRKQPPMKPRKARVKKA